MYYEPGMSFCGIYNNGFDEYYEYGGMSLDDIRKTIPDELDKCFMISEYIEELDNQDFDN